MLVNIFITRVATSLRILDAYDGSDFSDFPILRVEFSGFRPLLECRVYLPGVFARLSATSDIAKKKQHTTERNGIVSVK